MHLQVVENKNPILQNLVAGEQQAFGAEAVSTQWWTCYYSNEDYHVLPSWKYMPEKTFLERGRRLGLAKMRQNQALDAVGHSLPSLPGCSSEIPFLKVTVWAGCWSQTVQSEVLLPWSHCGTTEICFSSILFTRRYFKNYLYVIFAINSLSWVKTEPSWNFKLCTSGRALSCLWSGTPVKSSNDSNDNSNRKRCSCWDTNLWQSWSCQGWDSADTAAARVPFPGNGKKLHTSLASSLAGCARQFCHQRQSQPCIFI